jgi:hypothetical protein
MKVGIKNFHVMPLRSFEHCENRCNEMHALREGLHAMSPYYLRFFPMLMKFGIMDDHKNLLKEYVSGKAILDWIFVRTF